MQKGLDALCCTTRTHMFWLMLVGSQLGRHWNPSTQPPLHVASPPCGLLSMWPPLHVVTPWGGLGFLTVWRLCFLQTVQASQVEVHTELLPGPLSTDGGTSKVCSWSGE